LAEKIWSSIGIRNWSDPCKEGRLTEIQNRLLAVQEQARVLFEDLRVITADLKTRQDIQDQELFYKGFILEYTKVRADLCVRKEPGL